MPNKRIYLCLAHMSGNEQKYIQEAFDTNWVVPLGPNVNGFEEDLKQFVGGDSEVVALSAGTAAVHLALIACGVGPGDEVCVQSFTFCASSNPIKYLGATPVFIDSEPDTWNMDPDLLKEAILDRIAKTGKKPKAIIPVALYGMPYQIDRIMEIAERYDIPVIEDAAEGFGSRYHGKMLGTFGRFGVLSFNGNKMITTSGGGALICRNAEDKNQIMWLATQAREAYPYYQHEAIGYNYRLSNICAGIGRGQMTVANDHIAHHRHIAAMYREAFAGIEGVTFHDEYKPHPRPLSGGEGSVLGHSSSEGEGSVAHNTHRPLWQTADLSTYEHLKGFARENRKNPTEAEDALWQALRNKKLGCQFRRQHPIHEFIVDFVCLGKMLTIEVDGEYHNKKEQAEYDKFRTMILNELGYRELRFTNEEVLHNMDKVIESIKEELSKTPAEPNSPSPAERGRGEDAKKPYSNFWLNTITLDPSLKIRGQERAYGKAVTGAVGGAAGVVHQAASITTDCQPNDNVEALRIFMDEAGVEARPLWKPMHKQPVYQDCPAYLNGVSEALFKCGICLPSGPCVTDDDVSYIIDNIKKAII